MLELSEVEIDGGNLNIPAVLAERAQANLDCLEQERQLFFREVERMPVVLGLTLLDGSVVA